MKPKVYSSQGPRREIHLVTNGDDDLIDHGFVQIKSSDGKITTSRIKSITLEFE